MVMNINMDMLTIEIQQPTILDTPRVPKNVSKFLLPFTNYTSSQTPTDSPLAHLPLTSNSTTLSSSYVTRYNGDFSFRFFISFGFSIWRVDSDTRVYVGMIGGKANND